MYSNFLSVGIPKKITNSNRIKDKEVYSWIESAELGSCVKRGTKDLKSFKAEGDILRFRCSML